MNIEIIVAPASLNQQNAVQAIRAQPVCQHATGRAGADHDEIEFNEIGRITS
jgi:hypothetical protein